MSDPIRPASSPASPPTRTQRPPLRTGSLNGGGTRLLTVGEIARHLNVPLHRVTYVLYTRPIDPVAVAGRTRLFDNAALARVRHEIEAINARQSASAGGPVL